MSARRRDGRLELALDRSWELHPNTWSSMTWWDPLACGDSLLTSLLSDNARCPPPSPTTSLYTNPPTPFEFRDPPPTPTNFSFRGSASSSDPSALRRTSDESIFSPLAWPLPTTPAGNAWSPSTGLSSTSSQWPSSLSSTFLPTTTTTPHTWASNSTSPNNWPHKTSSTDSPLAWPLPKTPSLLSEKTPSPDFSHYSIFSNSMYSEDPSLQTIHPYSIFPTPPDTNVPPPPLRTALQDTSIHPPLLPTPPSTVRRGLRRSQRQVFKFPAPPPPAGSLGPFLAPPPGPPPLDITRHPPPTLRLPNSVCLK